MEAPSTYSGSMAGTPGPGPFASAAGGFRIWRWLRSPIRRPAEHVCPPVGHRRRSPPPLSVPQHPLRSRPGSHSAGPFDSRAAEAAFQSATNGPASAGPSQNFYSGNENDPFAFLSSSMSNLAVGNESRQNGGGAPPSKSPA